MKVLLLHHLEPYWERSYQGKGTNFFELQERAAKHIAANSYDKVILTRFMEYRLTADYWPPFARLVHEVYEYEFGWLTTTPLPENHSYCEGGEHSQVVLITPWLRDLQGHKVSIGGAFDGECIEDLEIALRHLKIRFKRIESLIV